MGFTPDSTGKPVFNDTASTQADLQGVADFAFNELSLSGPIASRPTSGAYPGQKYYATDQKALTIWTGSAWIGGDALWQAITLGGAWTPGPGQTPQVRVKNGVAYLRGYATRNSNITTPTVVGTVPAAARPTQTIYLVCGSQNQAIAPEVSIAPDGTITVNQFSGSSAVLLLSGAYLTD